MMFRTNVRSMRLTSLRCVSKSSHSVKSTTTSFSPRHFSRRTFATSSSNATSSTTLDQALDKLFDEQEYANAAAEAVAAVTWDPSYTNVADLAVEGITWIHNIAGIGYGEAIVGSTLLVRIALFPLFVKLQRNSARMAHMQPEMKLLKEQMEALPPNVDHQTRVRMGLQMRSLFQKYDVNPFSSMAAPFVQLPIFMGMFFGLRKMPDYNEFIPLLQTEGLWWFPDLTAADPYYILPAMSAATMLASVELGKAQMMASGQQGETMVNVFRALSIVMVPAVASFSSALNLYWVTNNTFTALQAGLFQIKGVRKALDIWDMPPPVPGMPQAKSLLQTVQDTVQPKPTEKQLLQQHNEAVESKKQARGVGRNRRRGGGKKRNIE
jgi:YidC/Oxa1 family membrane protein insertase